MKDLIIPNKVKNAINLSDINFNFKGLIIAYEDTEATGYINWYDGYWVYADSLNYDDRHDCFSTLTECIECIAEDYGVTNFKVIEFTNDK